MSIDALLEVNKPDVREELIKAYGDQGITGFLKLTGAVRSGGTADFVRWYEEGRRHPPFELIDGRKRRLEQFYYGKVLIIVNVASF